MNDSGLVNGCESFEERPEIQLDVTNIHEAIVRLVVVSHNDQALPWIGVLGNLDDESGAAQQLLDHGV